jgi:hypothetical protein
MRLAGREVVDDAPDSAEDFAAGRGPKAATSNVQTGQGKDGKIKVDLSKL